MKLDLLENLYTQTLAKLLDAEKQSLRVLPKVAERISDPELRKLFGAHIEQTKQQVKRLQPLISRQGAKERITSKAMRGLLEEAKELLEEEDNDPDVLDAALVEAAEQVEGHEVSAYACAFKFARMLGHEEDLKPLETSFNEEQKMEELLVTVGNTLDREEASTEREGAAAK